MRLAELVNFGLKLWEVQSGYAFKRRQGRWPRIGCTFELAFATVLVLPALNLVNCLNKIF
jgi:hypothetical protein